ncbi:GtrA family protein [Olivibacter sitiensis]|uniref:GtrA family protein n=1 Tax=Olivibacter sitiensis TaxID=376470 RepID=UPI0003FD198A|nr:GtrA family protein [Olivibacter sitiensis]
MIGRFIDFFYPPFSRYFTKQQFRYAACGGGNTVFSVLLYPILYNFVLRKEILHLGFVAISPHIAALGIAFGITFPIGFLLNRYVVFQGSYLRKRTQAFRYFLVAMCCLLFNYLFLKLFVEVFGWYPTPSQVLTTAIITIFSYLSQKHFSFRTQKIDR